MGAGGRTFIVAKPRSHPLMTCCRPMVNLNSWPRVRELSNCVPSCAYVDVCVCVCVCVCGFEQGAVRGVCGWNSNQPVC